MSAILEQLTRRQLLWHGNSQRAAYQAVASGFAEVDQQLAGGFPATGLIDIQTGLGIGELRLLLPYLQHQQSSSQRLLVMISPPHRPAADMLAAEGIALSQLIIIQPKNTKEALWAAEQCLQSGCAAVVLLWQVPVKRVQARRLQLAAEQSQASMVLLHQSRLSESLPAQLSLQLTPHRCGLQITVQKRKGGWPGSQFIVNMQQRWPALTLSSEPAWQDARRAG